MLCETCDAFSVMFVVVYFCMELKLLSKSCCFYSVIVVSKVGLKNAQTTFQIEGLAFVCS